MVSRIVWGSFLGLSIGTFAYWNWDLIWIFFRSKKAITLPIQSKKKKIDDKTYMENATKKFLESYANKNEKQDAYNTSIEPVFYVRDEYKEAVRDAGNELEKRWQRRILLETTPRGNVIMFYDAYKLAFSYYADVFIPYSILNAVAMKYALTYRCRDFFTDETVIPKEYPSALHRFLTNQEEDQESATQKKKEIREMIQSGPFIQPKKKESTKPVEPTKQVSMTRILHLGNIKNFRALGPPMPKKVKISKKIPTSYADFIKFCMNLKKEEMESSFSNFVQGPGTVPFSETK